MKAIAAAVAVCLLAGCATSSKDVTAAYIHPLKFKFHDCEQLAQEAHRVSGRARELAPRVDQAANNDAMLTGVGMILFWPALLFLGRNEQQEAELSYLKGQADAIQEAGIARKCHGFMQQPVAKG
jgi:outer membrane murein-binding lipoprotein Lpp